MLNHATLTDTRVRIPGIKLRKIYCILTVFATTEHSIPWTRLFEMQRKHLETYYHMYLSNKYSCMSRLQVCLDICTQSKITQNVT
jgi:hypothetical protein